MPCRLTGGARRARVGHHAAAPGKLDCVANEIRHDLVQAGRIADITVRQLRIDCAFEREVLDCGEWMKDRRADARHQERRRAIACDLVALRGLPLYADHEQPMRRDCGLPAVREEFVHDLGGCRARLAPDQLRARDAVAERAFGDLQLVDGFPGTVQQADARDDRQGAARGVRAGAEGTVCAPGRCAGAECGCGDFPQRVTRFAERVGMPKSAHAGSARE